MGDFGAMFAALIIFALIWWALQESGKRSAQAREIAVRALQHVPAFLRERTRTGPWFEMDYYFWEWRLDIKCTACEIDRVFVCNASGETECVDLHYSDAKFRIKRGEDILFNGDPLNLMSYPEEGYYVRSDDPGPQPPKESGAYKLYEEVMRRKRAKTP